MTDTGALTLYMSQLEPNYCKWHSTIFDKDGNLLEQEDSYLQTMIEREETNTLEP